MKPETLDASELGWKTEFGAVRLNGAVFYYKYKDIVVQITNSIVGGGGPTAQNAAAAQIYGLEQDLTWAVSRQFQLSAAGGYLHAAFKNYIGDAYTPAFQSAGCAAAGGADQTTIPGACLGYVDAPGTNLSGRPLPLAPEFTGYVRGEYTVDLPKGSNLIINALVNYSSSFKWGAFDAAGTERSRYLSSASITWNAPGERYWVRLFGDNLFNTKYTTAQNFQPTGGWYVPGPPPTLGVKVGAKF